MTEIIMPKTQQPVQHYPGQMPHLSLMSRSKGFVMNYMDFLANGQEKHYKFQIPAQGKDWYSFKSPYDLRMVAPFKDLLPPADNVVLAIAEDMLENGYCTAHPIVTWAGHDNVVIDGHLRLRAAMIANLDKVCVAEHEFDTENDACIYALKRAIFRRHDPYCHYMYGLYGKLMKHLRSEYKGMQCGELYE